MDAGSILIVLALAIAVIVYVARPLAIPEGVSQDPHDHALSTLKAEHEQILTVLQEMDMDHDLGKIEETDYQALRLETLERGADVLRRLDALGAVPEHSRAQETDQVSDDPGLESMIEQEIAKRRAGAAYCSQCGKPVLAGDMFCSNCGAALKREESTA